jgi:hypothetical protein
LKSRPKDPCCPILLQATHPASAPDSRVAAVADPGVRSLQRSQLQVKLIENITDSNEFRKLLSSV